ncbi:MAG: hypothetical protein N2Z20_01135 [Elusimicrobiales bacterium]|nr:hypothetical protein [Elusimicrobiales bacterium]
MNWGLTKDIKTKKVENSWEQKGIVMIRYFWKNVFNILKDIDADVLKQVLVETDFIDAAMDEANEAAKKYFKGEVELKELKKALEKCYQSWLRVYHLCKEKSG